jgi:hypothetical protein
MFFAHFIFSTRFFIYLESSLNFPLRELSQTSAVDAQSSEVELLIYYPELISEQLAKV